MDKKLTFFQKIDAYKLKNNFVVVGFLLVVFATAIAVYLIPGMRENEVIANIALACFTSLLATIFAMIADIYVKYRACENDRFLEDIHAFGIENLNKNKEEFLKEVLEDCDKTIWISGYRLILTDRIKGDVEQAMERGAAVTALICPPWSDGFKLVYGEQEQVMEHYLNVFHSIRTKMKSDKNRVLFVEKPLFSDTYRVDQILVTGPYMHNKDLKYNRLMAKDFFSYKLKKRSPLYTLIYNEFVTLCQEAVCELDWEAFDRIYEASRREALSDTQIKELMQKAVRPVGDITDLKYLEDGRK